jgi:hypothetical protein
MRSKMPLGPTSRSAFGGEHEQLGPAVDGSKHMEPSEHLPQGVGSHEPWARGRERAGNIDEPLGEILLGGDPEVELETTFEAW